MADTPDPDQLAIAMLTLMCDILGIPTVGREAIDAPLFSADGCRLGVHPVESVQILEFMAVLEGSFALRLINNEELRDAPTLRRLATIITDNANHHAVQRFCEASEQEHLP